MGTSKAYYDYTDESTIFIVTHHINFIPTQHYFTPSDFTNVSQRDDKLKKALVFQGS